MALTTIRSRLRLAAAGIAAILLIAAAAGWLIVLRLSNDIAISVGEAVRVQSLTNRFTLDVGDELRAADDYLIHRDEEARRQFIGRGRDAHYVQSLLARSQATSTVANAPSDAELLARIDQELSAIEITRSRSHRLADLGDIAGVHAALEPAGALEAKLRSDVSLLSAHQADRVAVLAASVRQTALARAGRLGIMLLAAICIVALLAWMLARSISRPLDALVEHAQALHNGARGRRTSPEGLPGEFQALAGAMNDASESLESLARTEAALAQSEKLAAIGTLISGVAHELNNPLQTILLTAELMTANETSSPAKEDLRQIHEQVMRARTIITDLLTTVRPENVRRDSAPLEVVLNGLTPELVRLADRHHTTIQFVIDSPLPPIMVDRHGLTQVMTNLVANGAQASGTGGRLHVRAARCTAGCEILIDDSGPGIPATVFNRIFEPFFSTKEVGKGTGLGLSVSRGIVESMHGELTARSHWGDPSTGARFRIFLPVGSRAGNTPASTRAVPSSTGLPLPLPYAPTADRKRRILIVDDEQPIQRLVQRYFSERGWTVDCASDGFDALAKIEARCAMHERYVVIFCDLRMPAMSGIGLHETLSERHPDVLRDFVFLSGDLVSDDVRDFIRRSNCRVLAKPIDVSAMASVVHDAWAQRTSQREVAHA